MRGRSARLAPETRHVIMLQAPQFCDVSLFEKDLPDKPHTVHSVCEHIPGFVVRMNSSYGSFNFTGGWQDDQFAESAGYLDSSLLSPPDGRTDAAGNLHRPSTASSPDEWLFAHPPWPQQSTVYDGSLSGNFDNFDAFEVYTTAPGYTYDAEISEMSDLNQCQSQSSFSESDFDFEHLHTAHYGETDCRTNSFSSPVIASPTREAIYQTSPTSAYMSLGQQQQQAAPPQQILTQFPTSNTTQHYPQPQPQPQPQQPPNAPPTHEHLPSSPLHPRRQPARFTGDLYTPPYVRGDGATRAGWCTLCSSWHTLKDSAYWYHMHFAHGISCATGKSMPTPLRSRLTAGAARGVGDSEALCGCCGRWVLIVVGDKGRTAWWRHAYRCKFKDGGVGVSGVGGGGSAVVLGKERRSRGKSASPRKVVARPATAGAASGRFA
jgi:hypothetical protein